MLKKHYYFLLIIASLFVLSANAQEKLPVIKSNTNVISIQDGDDLKKDSWTLSPEAKPDVYETYLSNGKPKKVSFITDIDSISFTVEQDKTYDFIIQKDDELSYTRIVGKKLEFWNDPQFWESNALKTVYKTNIGNEEKIVGLSKIWSEAKYNFANFQLVPDLDWDKTYLEFIPKAVNTKSTLEYYRVLQEFIGKLKDGHTSVSLPNEVADEIYSRPGVRTRLVENRVIIIDILDEKTKQAGLKIGQEITAIDGIPVKEYADKFVAPFQASSTPQWLDYRVYEQFLLAGSLGKVMNLKLKDLNERNFEVNLPRMQNAERAKLIKQSEPFEMKMLPGNVAHIKLNTFTNAGEKSADEVFKQRFSEIEKADALILDLR